MRRNKGSVSVFFAVVFLTLIVFVLSIVEVTRYQIMKVQAEQILISATQSVLAGYDAALKNEYGLFARNPNYCDYDFLATPIVVAGDMAYEKDLGYYAMENLQTSQLDFLKVKGDGRYNYGTSEGRTYAKNDMVDYVALRLPLMGFNQVADFYEVSEKLGKTTKFIADKNKVVDQAVGMEALMADLYLDIDGIKVDKDNGPCAVMDTQYVNRLYMDLEANMSHLPTSIEPCGPILAYKTIPGAFKAYADVIGNVEGLGPLFIECRRTLEEVEGLEEDIEIVLKRIEDTKNDLDHVNDDIHDERDAIREGHGSQSRLSRLRRERSSLNAELKDLKKDLKALNVLLSEKQMVYRSLLDQMSRRVVAIDQAQLEVDAGLNDIKAIMVSEESVYSHVASALLKVEEVQKSAEILKADIDQFVALADNKRSDFMVGAYEHSIHELEAIKSGYGVGGDDYYDTESNLRLMSEGLSINQTRLESIKAPAQKVLNHYNYLLAASFEKEGMNRTDVQEMVAMIGGEISFHNHHLYYGTWDKEEGVNNVVSWLQAIDEGLKGYQQVPYMSYSKYDAVVGDGNRESVLEVYKNMKGLIDRYQMDLIFAGLDLEVGNALPQGLYSERLMLDHVINKTTSTGTGGQEDGYEAMADQMSTVTQVATDIKELLLLNEYAVGMFRSYPDSKRTEAQTLSGYSKLAHPYVAELEYIYTGEKDAQKALAEVGTKIFALRIGVNLIHLASDGTKRATIGKIAQNLTGWWSGPVGSVLAAVLIGLAWATLESCIDVERLLRGLKVPLLKTSITWYTDVDGIGKLITEGMATFAENIVVKGIDKASETIKEESNALIQKVGNDSQDFVEDQVNAMFGLGEQLMGTAVDTFDTNFSRGIDATLAHYRSGTQEPQLSDYLEPGTAGYEVLEEAVAMIDQEVLATGDISYMGLVLLKESVVLHFERRIEAVKEQIAGEVKTTIDQSIETSLTYVNDQVDEISKEGQKASKAYIQRAFDIESLGLKEKVGTLEPLQGIPENELKTAFMPEIDYEMYVRLFMVMDGQGLEDRLVRMMNLIDFNLAYGRLDSSDRLSYEGLQMSLEGYMIGVGASLELTLPYLFLDLPLPAMKAWPGEGYAIEVEVVNRYD